MENIDLEKWKKRKEELGLTLDDIVERTSISKRTISGIFSGKDEKYKNPTAATIREIERALEILPDERPLCPSRSRH